jgi:hypothetical protein
MKTLILSSETCLPSCKLLRDKIQEISGKKYLITKDRQDIDVLFRYGNNQNVLGKDGLNSKEFINLVSHKNNFSIFCQENSFYSPQFYRGGLPNKYPVLIRTTLSGYGGEGIIVCKNEQEFRHNWQNNYWWTPYVTTEFELRLHVASGKVLKVFKKVREEGLEDEEYPIRNNSRGYHFSLREENNYPKATEIVERLHPLLEQKGGVFYAVDAGWDKINQKYFVYELNSAPGLNDNTAQSYAENIIERI